MIPYPDWTRFIRNHYWHLRYARSFDTARIRKQYRLIEMVNLKNKPAAERFHKAYQKSLIAAA